MIKTDKIESLSKETEDIKKNQISFRTEKYNKIKSLVIGSMAE